MDETGDSVPDVISPDTFHRETGKALPKSAIDSSRAMTQKCASVEQRKVRREAAERMGQRRSA